MAKPYFSLLLNEPCSSTDGAPAWGVQFGDWDKECVEDEREAFLEDYPAKSLRIIRTDGTQAAIDAAVRKLNDWRGGAA